MSRKVTRNSCNMCTPLGACLALFGIEGAVPLLHGSQGCATYMRRFIISHFREPVDIASSSFSEDAAIFGGENHLRKAVENVARQYQPGLIGIASTCLSETIGDNVSAMISGLCSTNTTDLPVVSASTPSYKGNHTDGFSAAVTALVLSLGRPFGSKTESVNMFPSILSCADLRALKEMFLAIGVSITMLPDYSDRLDSGAWSEYQLIAPGGTPIAEIEKMPGASLSLAFRSTDPGPPHAATHLEKKFGVEALYLHTPIGLTLTDKFWESVCCHTGAEMPMRYRQERSRLLDALADAHKYLSRIRVAIVGDVDLIVPLSVFAIEVGMTPVLVATGAESAGLLPALNHACAHPWQNETELLDNVDFEEIGETRRSGEVELIIGTSRAYRMARKLDVPLVRTGFPVHDRIGGPRMQHIGYSGALELLDRICNELIERSQDRSPVGYSYM